MSKVTIYHNPRCSKNRQTLALLRGLGIEPNVIEYLKEPPDAETLAAIVKKLGIKTRDLVRTKAYRALGLEETDDSHELLKRMANHPEIIERPIVVIGNQARLGRPPEQVLDIVELRAAQASARNAKRGKDT